MIDVGSPLVRRACPRDLPLLPAIERAAAEMFRSTPHADLADWPLASATANLESDHIWVAADADDHPVAFAIAHTLAESVHLHELDVHPRHARQGLGRRLIEAVAAWARARGATALTLMTFRDIPWNGPYYERLGFRILDEADLPPDLEALRQAEAASGLPMDERIAMRLVL